MVGGRGHWGLSRASLAWEAARPTLFQSAVTRRLPSRRRPSGGHRAFAMGVARFSTRATTVAATGSTGLFPHFHRTRRPARARAWAFRPLLATGWRHVSRSGVIRPSLPARTPVTAGRLV